MARKRNIDKLHEAIGGEMDSFADKSSSWVTIENDKFSLHFIFDGKGEELKDIKLSEKIWQVTDEKLIVEFNYNKS